MLIPLIQATCALCALLLLHRLHAWIWGNNATGFPLPPGPRGLPILGNIRDTPSMPSWVTYKKWSTIHRSPVISLRIFGRSIIILNTLQAVTDLLEKRSAIYSDRPRLVMFTELCGFTWATGMKPYGRTWRRQRKLLHSQLHSQVADHYHPIQQSVTHEFLRRLLRSPDGFLEHIHFLIGSQIAEMTFGFKVKSHNDRYLQIAQKTMESASAALAAGQYLVDLFPPLKHIPSWFPGAEFQRQAKAWREPVEEMVELPFSDYKQRAAHGDIPNCMATNLLSFLEDPKEEEESCAEGDIKEILATIYAGGSDTTVSSLQSFFLAMVLYPEVQVKARTELDKVCPDRLPTFDDAASLPYIEAIVREVLRWMPVVPEALPHATTEDDVYEGYFIPKGSIIIPNSWAILHDDSVYSDPSIFNPARFIKDGVLNPDVQNPDIAAFGYGRRICPGRFVVHGSLWHFVALTLAVFDIRPKINADGKPLVPSGECDYGSICNPKPFVCDISPRSERHAALIHDE